MPSLLDIPPELRECIIQQVIYSHRTPPETPSKVSRVDFQDIAYSAWRSEPYGIYHEQASIHCPSNSRSLLLANQQLSAETRAVIYRMKSTTYSLDISVLNDVDLFPTWLSVPYITNRVSTVYADVRLFGHIVSDKVARDQSGAEGRFRLQWSFYALLERFLRYGPVGEKKETSGRPKPKFRNLNFDDYDVTVKLLVLDFRSADPEQPFPPGTVDAGLWGTKYSRNRRAMYINLEGHTTRPELFSRRLVWEIDSLLSMSYHTAGYGNILYERIGTIHMLVDGDLTHEIDLASRLASLRYTCPSETFGHLASEKRIPAFWNWKKERLARRERLGFPVVWPDDPELAWERRHK